MTKLTKVFCYAVVIVILLVSSALLIFQHREEAKFYPNEFVKYPTSTNPIILVAGNSFEVKLNYSELVFRMECFVTYEVQKGKHYTSINKV